MKLLSRLPVKILISVVVGLMLASVTTIITYNCPPIDGAMGCVSFEKAVMHPGDLFNNKQNSLWHFSETFVVVALASFGLISTYSWAQTKKKT